jgi:hypothetical protein
MSLPDLAWQIVYGRLAWAVVLAAVAFSLLPLAWRRSRMLPVLLLAGAGIACALPGPASPAWGLGLAFQYPSGLLVACCLLKLFDHRAASRGARVLTPALASGLALLGAALYLDTFGLIAQGYYHAGFGPNAAPLMAVLAALACAAAIVRRRALRQAVPLLGALVLFSSLRLPTGNLWDALIDPLLWGWALVALGAAALRKLRRAPAESAPLPEAAPGLAADLPSLRAAGADTYSNNEGAR